jgi:biotin synthase
MSLKKNNDWEGLLKTLYQKAIKREIPTKEELLELSYIPIEELPLLVYYAGKVKNFFFGNSIQFCSIINAKSGNCNQDCKFCAQSKFYDTKAPIYDFVEVKTILKGAEWAYKAGSKHYSIVLSGKRASRRDIEKMCEAAVKIKELYPDLKLCFSAGTLREEEISWLKQAGFDRLHHNLETSKEFFPQIVSTHTWEERLRTIEAAKKVGIEICSGGIFGLGESWENRIDLALTLRNLEVDSIPLNFLIPIKGTPLENRPLLKPSTALIIIAIFRFVNPTSEIRLAGGRELILGDYLGMANFMVNAHMIGGYLTRPGRAEEIDKKMVEIFNERN